ncbi:hypothetical protein [Flavobacterium sp.]
MEVIVMFLTMFKITPFWGFKQSGIGREYDIFTLRRTLRSKAILE